MPRLPTVGGDAGNWGDVLNDYLSQSHKPDGSLRADVANIADLKALDVTQIRDKMQTLVGGYYAHGDGGGGVFYYDAMVSDADNGGTVIAPSAGYGRWKRIYSGATNVKWFGAKGDGTTPDAPAINACTALGGNIFVPVGVYQILEAIELFSNTSIHFEPGALLSIAADAISAIYVNSGSNISVIGATIDGGGSYTNEGIKAGRGIYLTGVTHFRIIGCTITNMGCMNTVPASDIGYGGFGIVIRGASKHGEVRRCSLANIAGGGMGVGDGIYIGGDGTEDVSVTDCYVSTCGRHCYTAASGTAGPDNIQFVNCYGDKAALSGLDIEPGTYITVQKCTFISCGNDTTYYNPVTEFGSAYRLCAGIAHGNNCDNVSIIGTKIRGCHYGITIGGAINFVISDCHVSASDVSDLHQKLASGPVKAYISNTTFNTASDTLSYYVGGAVRCNVYFVGCDFYGPVKASSLKGAAFMHCVFRKGWVATAAGISHIVWQACEFRDFGGVGIDCSGANYLAAECIVRDCRFLGTGNMTVGINHAYRSALRWIIEGCTFDSLTIAGVYNENASGCDVYKSISGNIFKSCADGISVVRGITGANISNNMFFGVTGYCIDVINVSKSNSMQNSVISGNIVMPDCINGIRVCVPTGIWDYCVISNNNIRASGNRLSLSAGNINGIVSNNIS